MALSLSLSFPAMAQEVVIDPVKVTAEQPDPPPAPGLETVQAEEVDLQEDSDVTWITLEDVLESTPSVKVRSFGAPGSPSFMSIRGTDATHTLVMLDGLPLNDAATGFVDLSTVPVSILSSATVVRGGHPSGSGPYHPGGVVLLETRDLEPGIHAGVTLTAGFYPLGPRSTTGQDAGLKLRSASEIFQFGAQRKLSLYGSSFDGTFGILAAGSLESADGDFAYLGDAGTVYNIDDDRFLSRSNNAHGAASGLFKVTWLPDWSSQLVLGGLVNVIRDGLPGIDVLPTEHSELSRMRAHLGLTYQRWRDDLLSVPFIDGSVFLRYTSLEFFDPNGEISLTTSHGLSRDLTGGLRYAMNALRPDGAVLGLDTELTLESWRSFDGLHPETDAVRTLRLNLGLGLNGSVPLWEGRIVVEGSIRGSLLHDVIVGTGGGETRPYFSPRAGVRFAPLPFLSLTASVAYTHRPPTFMELFGNGGLFRGNDSLMPERGFGGDLNARIALPEETLGDLTLSLSTTGFINVVSDQIVFIQNSQRTMVAQNVAKARIAGFELEAHAGWTGWARVQLGYTLLDPIDLSGIDPYDHEMLPNRPRHDLFLEAGLFHWGVELSWQADHISGGYVDRSQQQPISNRTIHTLQLTWEPWFAEGLSFDVKWYNVGNALVDRTPITSSAGISTPGRRAITDVDGYPLPGTALFFTLAYNR